MARAQRHVGADGTEHAIIECPGCGEPHVIPVSGPRAWGFNGDYDRPTLSPSILATADRLVGFDVVRLVCHSFVCEGTIQFLGDSTHALAGQTVDLLEVIEA